MLAARDVDRDDAEPRLAEQGYQHGSGFEPPARAQLGQFREPRLGTLEHPTSVDGARGIHVDGSKLVPEPLHVRLLLPERCVESNALLRVIRLQHRSGAVARQPLSLGEGTLDPSSLGPPPLRPRLGQDTLLKFLHREACNLTVADEGRYCFQQRAVHEALRLETAAAAGRPLASHVGRARVPHAVDGDRSAAQAALQKRGAEVRNLPSVGMRTGLDPRQKLGHALEQRVGPHAEIGPRDAHNLVLRRRHRHR